MSDEAIPTPNATLPSRRPHPAVPSTVSAEAQAMLSRPAPQGVPGYPDLADTEGWAAYATSINTMVRPYFEASLPPAESYDVIHAPIAGVSNFTVRPRHAEGAVNTPVFIEIHGGALYLGGGELSWMPAAAHAIVARESHGLRITECRRLPRSLPRSTILWRSIEQPSTQSARTES